MTPRQLSHLQAAIRAISHASALMETHVANGGKESALFAQVVNDANVCIEEVKLVMSLEEIARGPRRWFP